MDEVMSDVPREGYLRNVYGEYVNREHIHERVRREHDLVEAMIGEAESLQALLAIFKGESFEKIAEFRSELAAGYGAKLGGTRGGLTIKNFGDTLRITISEADSLTFGPELESAKALIDECLREWTEGGSENLRAVVNDAFHVGDNKKVRMDRVLGLRRLRITNDERWDRAMLAIGDAVRTERSKLYIRFYRRDKPEDQFRLIVLDVARV